MENFQELEPLSNNMLFLFGKDIGETHGVIPRESFECLNHDRVEDLTGPKVNFAELADSGERPPGRRGRLMTMARGDSGAGD